MQQYNVDIFDRNLAFITDALVSISSIDDDYITGSSNVIEIDPTELVSAGYFIRLKSDDYYFFGVITDVTPGEISTQVVFKSFITAFDEEVLFNTTQQGTGDAISRPTLETLIETYVSNLYIEGSDTIQRLPIDIAIDSGITQTLDWSFGYKPESEDISYITVKLYSDIIVPALNKYGIVIDVNPSFNDKIIHLRITKRTSPFKISADLPNVYVKTLKYNNQTIGTNKLIVYSSKLLSKTITYYVHSDRTWSTNNSDRITPVLQSVKIVTPKDDTNDAFLSAALEAAYSALSGTSSDNLIELETYTNDANVVPQSLRIGQKIIMWYKGASYGSILTGRILDGSKITLLFGSDRIEFTKRYKLYGGK